jgi:hypothetical protein
MEKCCFLCGTDWIFKYYLDELRLQRVNSRCQIFINAHLPPNRHWTHSSIDAAYSRMAKFGMCLRTNRSLFKAKTMIYIRNHRAQWPALHLRDWEIRGLNLDPNTGCSCWGSFFVFLSHSRQILLLIGQNSFHISNSSFAMNLAVNTIWPM